MILNIQTLRVLFTFLVVSAHLDDLYKIIGIQPFMAMIEHISVDGFIVVSAFLIPYTNAQRPRPPLGFFGRRMARLAPFYWAMTLVVAALSFVFPWAFDNTVATPEAIFKSLFFIPYNKHDGVIEPIVYVGWTLNYFVFYIVIHAIWLALLGVKRAWIGTGLTLITLVTLGFVFKPTDPILYTWTAPRLLSLVAGLLLCEWWLRVRNTIVPTPQKPWFKPLVFAIFAAAMAAVMVRDTLLAGVNPRVVGAFFACIAIGAAIVLNQAGAIHKSKIRDRLAEASFTIYLTHYFFTQAVTKIVHGFDITSPVLIVALLGAAYVCVALFGLIATKYAELPLERWVRARWSALETPKPPQTAAAE